jgi:two-component system, sensor histidine kinase and response regulator
LTSDAIDENRNTCLAAGMDGYMTKPINAAKLFATLSSLLPPKVSAACSPTVDWPSVLKRCGGGEEFATAIMQKFHAQAGPEVDRIQQALAQGNAEAVARGAHSVKSMAAYAGADAASEFARRIEELATQKQLAAIEPLLANLRDDVETTIQWIAANIEGVPDKTAGAALPTRE